MKPSHAGVLALPIKSHITLGYSPNLNSLFCNTREIILLSQSRENERYK